MSTQGTIESRGQFKDDPRSQAKRWGLEIGAAKEAQKKWHKQAEEAVRKFRDEGEEDSGERLNLFHSNVVTLRALLYGKTPQVDVGRRFDDADDDDARVAGEMLERHLNTDIEREGDNYAAALRYALEDWTLTDLGQARVRYVVETETVPEVPAKTGPCPHCQGAGLIEQPALGGPDYIGAVPCEACQGAGQVELAPAVPEHDEKTFEDVETDWVYWRDFLWSPCRTWHERRWVAFRAEMNRDELVSRFGKEIGQRVPLKERTPEESDDDAVKDAWSRAEVWEIWSKDDRKVYWYAEGYPRILDAKPDPLGLDGFFPCPRPLLSNATTTKMMPKPDYGFARHLYEKIDVLYSRVCGLEDALRVAGVYDASAEGLERLLTEDARNKLIPVKNWLVFAEKGGLDNRISWFPAEQVANALDKTEEQLLAKIALLHQVTGLSDIVRGQAASAATATEQKIKAGFVSTRAQTLQDEFARFASDLQKLRAEVISKHFDPQTILERSNVAMTPDRDRAPQAVELIRSALSQYRIQVRPESISLPDIAQQKAEGVEFLQALAGFLTPMQAIGAQMPAAVPYLLEMLKWALAKFRGASTIEGVLDRAIAEAQKPKPPPGPDPKVLALQAKAKADREKSQMDLMATKAKTEATVIGARADIAKTQAHLQADAQRMAMQGPMAPMMPGPQAGPALPVPPMRPGGMP